MQGGAVALGLLGGEDVKSVPYFWTDQYDVRVQMYGHPVPEAAFVVTAGAVNDGAFAGLYLVGDKPVAALAWSLPSRARALRAELAAAEATATSASRA